MSSTLCPNRPKAAPARCLPRPATTSWPRLLNLKYAMPAALSRVDSSRISGWPEENADPRPCTQMSAAAPPAAPRFGDDAVEPDAVASAEADERDGNACRPCHARTPAGFAEAVNRKSVWLSSSAPGPRWRRGRRRRLASQRGTLIRAGESRRVHAVRFLKYELLTAILPLWKPCVVSALSQPPYIHHTLRTGTIYCARNIGPRPKNFRRPAFRHASSSGRFSLSGNAVLHEVVVGPGVHAANRSARSLADLARRVDQLPVWLEMARVAARAPRRDREVERENPDDHQSST